MEAPPYPLSSTNAPAKLPVGTAAGVGRGIVDNWRGELWRGSGMRQAGAVDEARQRTELLHAAFEADRASTDRNKRLAEAGRALGLFGGLQPPLGTIARPEEFGLQRRDEVASMAATGNLAARAAAVPGTWYQPVAQLQPAAQPVAHPAAHPVAQPPSLQPTVSQAAAASPTMALLVAATAAAGLPPHVAQFTQRLAEERFAERERSAAARAELERRAAELNAALAQVAAAGSHGYLATKVPMVPGFLAPGHNVDGPPADAGGAAGNGAGPEAEPESKEAALAQVVDEAIAALASGPARLESLRMQGDQLRSRIAEVGRAPMAPLPSVAGRDARAAALGLAGGGAAAPAPQPELAAWPEVPQEPAQLWPGRSLAQQGGGMARPPGPPVHTLPLPSQQADQALSASTAGLAAGSTTVAAAAPAEAAAQKEAPPLPPPSSPPPAEDTAAAVAEAPTASEAPADEAPASSQALSGVEAPAAPIPKQRSRRLRNFFW